MKPFVAFGLLLVAVSLAEVSAAVKKTKVVVEEEEEEAEKELAPVTCNQVMYVGLPGCWNECMRQGGSPNCCVYNKKAYTATCECIRVPSVFKPTSFFTFGKKQTGCTFSTIKSATTQFNQKDEEDGEEPDEEEEGEEEEEEVNPSA